MDKLAIREIFDKTVTPTFACIDAYGKSMYFLTNAYKLNYNTYVLEMSDATFAEFCKINYSRRHGRRHNKIKKEEFEISDVPEKGESLEGCRVISVQKKLNLAYISYSRHKRRPV